MDKISSDAKERFRAGRQFWERYPSSEKGGMKDTLFSNVLIIHVSSIVRWIDFIRPLVYNPDYSKYRIGNDPVDRNELFIVLILQRIETMAFFVHAPEEYKIDLAKQMYRELRKRLRDRLRILDLLLADEPLLERLKVSKSKIRTYQQQDSQAATGLRNSRAGARKFLKELCYYPILLLMRFSGTRHSQRLDTMHELMTFAKAPFFGHVRFVEEERDRIRKWDDESIEWCNKLFGEKVLH